MQRKTLADRMKHRFEKRIEIFDRKSADYATDDALSNFSRVGKAIEILRIRELPPALSYSFTMVVLKLDRFLNLIHKEEPPENESIEDTVQDLQNYIDLTEAVYSELPNRHDAELNKKRKEAEKIAKQIERAKR